MVVVVVVLVLGVVVCGEKYQIEIPIKKSSVLVC